MKYLTVDQILLIHLRAVERFGGDPGIRDRGLVESAVYESLRGQRDIQSASLSALLKVVGLTVRPVSRDGSA